ncbi:MAG TPA: DUF4390 domain-containing protein [Nitrospiria bacterium]|nr:DUF4390 domain-containing protein [Nitrospiria bacterium]
MGKLGLQVFFFILCFLSSLILVPFSAIADENISDLSVIIQNKDIMVSARLVGAFSNTIEEDIKNGIPKDLFYYILLKRRQNNWIDEELLQVTIKYTIKYDILKKQYIVTSREGTRSSRRVIENYQEMADLITRVNNVKLTETDILNSNESYYVSVKAEMKATAIPLHLDYFFFFIPFLELDTPWADSSIIYPQGKAR